jgi:hypothetical protein
VIGYVIIYEGGTGFGVTMNDVVPDDVAQESVVFAVCVADKTIVAEEFAATCPYPDAEPAGIPVNNETV